MFGKLFGNLKIINEYLFVPNEFLVFYYSNFGGGRVNDTVVNKITFYNCLGKLIERKVY